MSHLRSHIVFLALTLGICCVAYPIVLWGVGRTAFAEQAKGSLVVMKGSDGTERVVGSRQIAQPFTADEYFWPRPSAASYNGAAAGGSNWGASNPKLRDRAARQLAAIIRFKAGSDSAQSGRTPQDDLAAWLATRPEKKADAPAAAYFDMWLQDPANKSKVAELEPVPADMVTASGAGLDPHITMRNALSVYQLDRVAAARGAARADIESLVQKLSFTPLSGQLGEPLVNVLELNAELDKRFPVRR